MNRRNYWLAVLAVAVSILAASYGIQRGFAQNLAVIQGIVVDENGPVGGATVRVQATANSTLSAADGTFTLAGLPEGAAITVSAWKHLYYCAKEELVVPPASGVTLTLRRYQANDNPVYPWIPPAGENSCYSCKPGITDIWLANDAHGRSGNNPRFLSLYNGTDIAGGVTVGPGYQLDFPNTSGNCATCHAPGMAVDAPFSTNMNALNDIDRNFGIHCDFCHKVADVYLNPATGLPYANAPGVISIDIRRPFTDSERFQLFFGTFDDDNVPLEDTNLPLIQKSQWCAACHQFSFWGTPIYQSFSEWLNSPYAAQGIECQACHMPSDGVMTNVAPGFGGVERDPQTIHAHTMPGAASEKLLQDTVAMDLTADTGTGTIVTRVTITNYGAGHHVPTDHPGRHMILTVKATDGAGTPLRMIKGQTVPEWGGAQAGLPGRAYAKVLQDVQSGEAPVVSYWKQAIIVSDNRIAALASDISYFTFEAPRSGGPVEITIELVFRRNFQPVMDSKQWDVADILMESKTITIQAAYWDRVYIPLAVK